MNSIKLNYLKDAYKKCTSKWQEFFYQTQQDVLLKIDNTLCELSKYNTIYPPKEDILNAFTCTYPDNIKVVIIGQDPYHGENEANGFSFSVNKNIKIPPSLRNILRELSQEYNIPINTLDGELLIKWAQQGVLLLNNTLTVIKDQPNSLNHIGWDAFTNNLIKHISAINQNVVFMLWGNFAGKKEIFITNKDKHLILKAPHPSPLSAHRGFLGCNHFIKANDYLIKQICLEILWLHLS